MGIQRWAGVSLVNQETFTRAEQEPCDTLSLGRGKEGTDGWRRRFHGGWPGAHIGNMILNGEPKEDDVCLGDAERTQEGRAGAVAGG